jgi:hypothetical protein
MWKFRLKKFTTTNPHIIKNTFNTKFILSSKPDVPYTSKLPSISFAAPPLPESCASRCWRCIGLIGLRLLPST